ncbi:hypothetical protein RV11_GL002543 [Enterococcus phoeniculicola]|nr:hypothetical protein RV11_GL002543 [Enterococcus phoeniculicola]
MNNFKVKDKLEVAPCLSNFILMYFFRVLQAIFYHSLDYFRKQLFTHLLSS